LPTSHPRQRDGCEDGAEISAEVIGRKSEIVRGRSSQQGRSLPRTSPAAMLVNQVRQMIFDVAGRPRPVGGPAISRSRAHLDIQPASASIATHIH